MKKVLSLLIAAALLLAMSAVPAFAANGPVDKDVGTMITFMQDNGSRRYVIVQNQGSGVEVCNTALTGAAYDLATNTLTITDLDDPELGLYVHYMGDDFTLCVEGRCALSCIIVQNYVGFYNTSLTITGSGSLTLNQEGQRYAAIHLSTEGDDQDMFLEISPSVTLDLYPGEEGVIICNNGTAIADADKAIIADGDGLKGVVTEQIAYNEFDMENVLIEYDEDWSYDDSCVAVSRSDPDGVYGFVDRGRYVTVNQYQYLEDLDKNLLIDSVRMSKADFEAEFTVPTAPQPMWIHYTSDENDAERGWRVVEMTKDGEPGEVYGGSPIWDDPDYSYDDPEEYFIYHLIWNEDEAYYYEDEDSEPLSVDADKLEENGFHIVTEEQERNVQLDCLVIAADPEEENRNGSYDLLFSPDDPDGTYVKLFDYTSDDPDDPAGIVIAEAFYDAKTDSWYAYEENRISVPDRDIGVTYCFACETVTVKKVIYFVDSYYSYEDYAWSAMLAENQYDNDFYAVRESRNDSGETEYSVYRLEYHADVDRYYQIKWDETDREMYGVIMSPEDFVSDGYFFVNEDQPIPMGRTGITTNSLPIYIDEEGTRYVAEWDGVVYVLDEEYAYDIGDEIYYLARRVEGLTTDDLISTEHEVITDTYSHTYKGKSYHHQGEGAPELVMLGNVDGDGEVTILDATCLQRVLAEFSVVNYVEAAADADGDGEITILDATSIQRFVAELPTNKAIGTYI